MSTRAAVLVAMMGGAVACGGEAVVSTRDAAPDVEPDATPPYDGQSCFIDGASFEQSCTLDSDCVEAPFGDVCTDGCHFVCNLGGTAINSKDDALYNAAVISAHAMGGPCSCGAGMGVGFQGSAAFCESGHCVGGYRQPGDSEP